MTSEFDFEAFQAHYGANALLLCLITEGRDLRIFTADHALNPQPGHTLITLVDPMPEE